MPDSNIFQPAPNGLYMPEDPKAKAKARLIAVTKMTSEILAEAGITGEGKNDEVLIHALGPDVFRLIYHEGLAE